MESEDVNAPEASLNHIVEEVEKLKHHLDYQVLVKVHPYLYKDALKIKRLKPYLIPDYFDTNEILAIVDLMITDYSSIFFDYLVTNKPIVFYTQIWMNINHHEVCILLIVTYLVLSLIILKM